MKKENDISTNIKKGIFDSIRHIDEDGNEYWEARKLMKVLDYQDWRNFKKVIEKSKVSAANSNLDQNYWGVEVTTPISSGKGKIEMVQNYRLSRLACYLIAQNGDPKKKVIALWTKPKKYSIIYY